jgi:hypothetical protein
MLDPTAGGRIAKRSQLRLAPYRRATVDEDGQYCFAVAL